VGAGGSQEAPYDLQASVPAGTYHFVLDCVIIKAVDVQFDLVWRRGSLDTTLATWQAHYDPLGGASFDAQPEEYDEVAPAIAYKSGDQLVFRYTCLNAPSASETYIPNGDGSLSKGRIPNITLPK
jgi:hypothetical protein